MIDSENTIPFFDQIGNEVFELLWLPSLETLLLGFLVWFMLLLNKGCTPTIRHVLWVLVLVKPILSVILPWEGFFEIPHIPLVHGVEVVASGQSALVSYFYAGAGLFWVTVVGIGLLRTVSSAIVMIRRRRRAIPVNILRVQKQFDSCLAELGIKKHVSLRVSDEFAGPVLIVLGKPVVIIPSWCILELSTTELKQILLHELAHYARRDHLTLLLVHFSKIFFFFHPTVWYASRRIGIEAERACDVNVIRFSSQPENYASTLLKVAGGKVRGHWQVALELARSASLVALRIRDVLGSTVTQEYKARSSGVIMASCLLLTVMPLFRSTIETATMMDVAALAKNSRGTGQIGQSAPPSVSLDSPRSMRSIAIPRIENEPGPVTPRVVPRSMIDGHPVLRRSLVAMMNNPYPISPSGVFESVDTYKINPAVLGLSSVIKMLDQPASLGKKLKQGQIEVQGVGRKGNELFNTGKVSLSAGYFVTSTHQLGDVYSIRRPNNFQAFDAPHLSSGPPSRVNLFRARKLAGFGNSVSLPGTVFDTQRETQVDKITRIGAFYRYNLPVLGNSFTPFLACGTGLEIRPQNQHLKIVDAGIGLRYFWARHVAVIVQAAYRKELDVPSNFHPEMSLGFSAIF